MTPQQLIAAVLAQRETSINLDDRLSVRIRRPAEAQIAPLLQRGKGGVSVHAGLDEVKAHVVGWDGFIESDFVTGGASDAVPFDSALWSVWIDDHRANIAPIAQAIVDAVLEHEKQAAETAKN